MRFLEYVELENKMGEWFTVDQMSYFKDEYVADDIDEHNRIVKSGNLSVLYGRSNRFEDEVDFNIELKSSFPNIDLVDEYRNKKNIMKFYCSACDDTFEKTGVAVLNSGCTKCSGNRFVGEGLIENELEKLELLFYKQESDGCINPKTGRELKYDFIVEHEGRNLYIEINGKQHYEPVEYFGGIDSYNGVTYRDGIKKKYANDNGVYVEIDYRESNKQLLLDRFYEKMTELGVC